MELHADPVYLQARGSCFRNPWGFQRDKKPVPAEQDAARIRPLHQSPCAQCPLALHGVQGSLHEISAAHDKVSTAHPWRLTKRPLCPQIVNPAAV